MDTSQTDNAELQDTAGDTPRKQSLNATSISSIEERLQGGSGKYMILNTKPLMFAKDSIKSKLFEASLDFVQ